MTANILLDDLANDLAPVRPLRDWQAVIGLAAFGLFAATAVGLMLGIREDVLAGTPHPMFLLRTGLLLMLGGICAAAALAMARPGIGRANRAWQAAVAMAGIVPATAAVVAIIDPAAAAQAVWWSSALWCLGVSLLAACGFAAIIVAQLRRGAPVSLERAGIVTGIAAGSLGVLVYSLYCPANSVAYIGLWYGLAIAMSTLTARCVVPPLIRW